MEVSSKNNDEQTVIKAIDHLCRMIIEKMSTNEVDDKKKNSIQLNQWTIDALKQRKKIIIVEEEI